MAEQPEPVISSVVCNHEFTPAQPVPVFSETELDSIIYGANAPELMSSLRSNVPNNGLGSTNWNLKWEFDTRWGLLGCKITEVRTTVDIVYELPLWPEQLVSKDRELTDQWNQYSDELRVHHCQHGRTGIDASTEIKTRLSQLAVGDSCESISVEADQLAHTIAARYKDLESQLTPPRPSEFILR